MRNLKKFLNIKLSFSLSAILIFIFFSFLTFFILRVQIEIDDMMVFASGIDLIKDIKNSQYISIVKGEPMKFEIFDGKFKISYTKENLIYINSYPLFKSVKIGPKDLNFIIKDDGTFEFLSDLNEIYLYKENKLIKILLNRDFSYKIKLRDDGTLLFEKIKKFNK